jgi:hypothetical protein
VSATVRPLPALNDNYLVPRPWDCITHETHDCGGPVVGAVGAIPVCAAGAVAELAMRAREDARRAALLADPAFQRLLTQECALEQRHEFGQW